jgi:hypothetical protein
MILSPSKTLRVLASTGVVVLVIGLAASLYITRSQSSEVVHVGVSAALFGALLAWFAGDAVARGARVGLAGGVVLVVVTSASILLLATGSVALVHAGALGALPSYVGLYLGEFFTLAVLWVALYRELVSSAAPSESPASPAELTDLGVSAVPWTPLEPEDDLDISCLFDEDEADIPTFIVAER